MRVKSVVFPCDKGNPGKPILVREKIREKLFHYANCYCLLMEKLSSLNNVHENKMINDLLT